MIDRITNIDILEFAPRVNMIDFFFFKKNNNPPIDFPLPLISLLPSLRFTFTLGPYEQHLYTWALKTFLPSIPLHSAPRFPLSHDSSLFSSPLPTLGLNFGLNLDLDLNPRP